MEHFLEKNQHCWKLVLSPLQIGQNYDLAKKYSAKYQPKCMVHFEDKGIFPKVHWRILEGSQPEYLGV